MLLVITLRSKVIIADRLIRPDISITFQDLVKESQKLDGASTGKLETVSQYLVIN